MDFSKMSRVWGPDEYPDLHIDITATNTAINREAAAFVQFHGSEYIAHILLETCIQHAFLVDMREKQHNIVAFAHQAAQVPRNKAVFAAISSGTRLPVNAVKSILSDWISADIEIKPWALPPWEIAVNAVMAADQNNDAPKVSRVDIVPLFKKIQKLILNRIRDSRSSISILLMSHFTHN